MTDRPNILLITTDQQRFDAMGLNGNRLLRTANLDALAAGGVNFGRAYSTCPSCIAARRTILTGLHCSHPAHGLPGYRDGCEWDPPWSLPALLHDVGYQTQLIGKFHMFPQRKRYGFDNLVLSEQMECRPDSPYFAHNDYATWLAAQGERFNPAAHGIGPNSWVARPFQIEENLHHTSWLVEEAIDFIRRRRDPSMPFFLHLSFWAPHPPLVPPQVYWDRYAGPDGDGWRPNIGTWAPNFPADGRPGLPPDSFTGPYDQRAMRDAMAGYYGLINHVDDRLGFLLGQVFQRGSARERMPLWILFTSDHGELLGDHQLFRKTLPYEGAAHVPFFITGRNVKWPGSRHGRRSDALVGLQDLLPTICDLAGAETPDGVQGRSLVPVLSGEANAVRDELHGEHTGGRLANHWIVRDRFKYCWFAETGEEQLFDLADDPHELRDLSGEAALLAPMRERLAEHLAGRTDYTYDPAALRPLAGAPPTALWSADEIERYRA